MEEKKAYSERLNLSGQKQISKLKSTQRVFVKRRQNLELDGDWTNRMCATFKQTSQNLLLLV